MHGYLSIWADFVVVLPPFSSVQEQRKHHLSACTLLCSCYQGCPASRQGMNSYYFLAHRAIAFAVSRCFRWPVETHSSSRVSSSGAGRFEDKSAFVSLGSKINQPFFGQTSTTFRYITGLSKGFFLKSRQIFFGSAFSTVRSSFFFFSQTRCSASDQ